MPDRSGPILDIDEPQEITSAASVFTTAVHTATGAAAGSADTLRPQTKPASDLDRMMCDQLGWVRSTFEAAARSSAGRADDVVVDALFGTSALENTDVDNGSRTRYESI
ncbi:hypothetical protein [Nocardia mangyaensis]|uniref:hypothetical protein n=1 Tax=Nocardia mangyaensis TaxID=2213200 RepID=UPI0026758B4C|nr:hypothetical protein [Nocardia mangyaensis]MDO3648222.1 hypothetical protein [Nocardia mangyaensis]